MKYRKKPVVIDAVQFDGANGEEIEKFTNCTARRLATHTPLMIISTLEGDHMARPGDWIIKGVEGEFYPCKDSIFKVTYDMAEGGITGIIHELVEKEMKNTEE